MIKITNETTAKVTKEIDENINQIDRIAFRIGIYINLQHFTSFK